MVIRHILINEINSKALEREGILNYDFQNVTDKKN